MPSQRNEEELTSIEDITKDAYKQDILMSLRDDDDRLSCLRLCSEDIAEEYAMYGDYHPGSSAELCWLGQFAKMSTHFDELTLFGGDIFSSCSEQSVDRFFEDIGRCHHIRKMNFVATDLTGIMNKLGDVMKNGKITHWLAEECDLGVPEANHLFNIFRDMNSLEELWIDNRYHFLDDDVIAGCIRLLATCTGMRRLLLRLPGLSTNSWAALSAVFPRMKSLQDLLIENTDHSLNDDIMAGCIPSLASCAAMRVLNLSNLDLSTNSCASLVAIFPQMAALLDLELEGNSIDDDCAKVLFRGLSECKRLHSLNLDRNLIGDDGFDVLIQGLPASVCRLDLKNNRITLARQLSILRFETLGLSGNTLCPGGPGVIATSLANPECRLEVLSLYHINIEDEGLTSLAQSLRKNQRLASMHLVWTDITETGWNEFSSVLCDTSSINATHGSNHTLQWLARRSARTPQDIKMMLQVNSDQDKSRVAANKILLAHRHLDMRPLIDWELNLLPHVVSWLERFAESRLDLKLSSIFQFVLAMPMDIIDGVTSKKKKGKKRLSSSI